MKKLILILILRAITWAQESPYTNMTGGEISELHRSRVGYKFYKDGFQTQLNFITLKEGAVTLQPGTYYVANTKNDGVVRLQKFVYSNTDTYILEIGHEYIRFFKGHAQIGVTEGEFTLFEVQDLIPPFGSEQTGIYEISTSYDGNDIDELSFYGSADTLFIDHKDYFPAKLVRYANANWILSDIDANDGPFLTQNDTSQTITSDDVSGTVDLTATGSALFDSGHLNSYWQISHVTDANTETGSFSGTGTGTSTFMGAGASYNATLTGTWVGTVSLEYSLDGTTYYKLREVTSNVEVTDTTDEAIHLRFNCTAYTSGTINYVLEVPSYTHNGVVKITVVTDPSNATATVVDRLYSTSSTTKWAEGAWSTYRGFPTTVSFYEGRLIHGGTSYQPLRVWFSSSLDIESYKSGDLATDSFSYGISGAKQNPIQWMEPRYGHGITIGTLGRIIVIQPLDSFSRISSTNPPTEKGSSEFSCSTVAPLHADNALIVMNKGGNRIGELLYSNEEDAILVSDLTRYADHITYGGLTDMDFQKRPEPILWTVRSDGNAPAMTYDRYGRVGAWHQHTFGGSVEQVEVLPLTNYDELWLVSSYTVDSNTVRFVLYMDELDFRKARDEYYFVNAGLTFDGGDTMTVSSITSADPGVVTVDALPTSFTDGHQVYFDGIVGMTELNGGIYTANDVNSTDLTFSIRDETNSIDIDTTVYTTYISDGNALWVEDTFGNLSHVEGESLTAVGFGFDEIVESVTVSSGSVQMSDYFNQVQIGYFDTATLKPSAFDTVDTIDRNKRLNGVVVTFFKTLGGTIGPDTDNLRDIVWDTEDGIAPLATEDKYIDFSGNLDTRSEFIIQQTEPLPMTVISIRPKIKLQGEP